MLKLALIGKNIKHSLSKSVYQKLLDEEFSYSLLDYETEEEIPNLNILLKEYDGVSVTSPYKNYIYQHVKNDKSIDELKAVNSIKIKKNIVYGTNTDYFACKDIIEEYKKKQIKKVLILGDGDMSRVIEKVIKENSLEYSISSRKNDSFLLLRKKSEEFDLLINCCSREFDISLYLTDQVSNVWDLNYAQRYENIIVDRIGQRYSNGERLLLLQAKYSCNYWEISEHF